MAVNTEDQSPGAAEPALGPAITSPVLTPLPSPVLGGAVGCDFRSLLNQLLFVEYSGKLSRMDLFPAATVASSGTTVFKGTWLFDLDTGTQEGALPGADIWWEQMTSTARQMAPRNGAHDHQPGSRWTSPRCPPPACRVSRTGPRRSRATTTRPTSSYPATSSR